MERQERQRNIQAGGVPIQLSDSEIKPIAPLMIVVELPINKVKKTILAKGSADNVTHTPCCGEGSSICIQRERQRKSSW